ncbi:hypothetical protein INS49_011840 [Diaporthe citri]|uniref:uncharacterized protein n=1 Tax=Diaporthe citri TaxID=83186 RepID=UPI001C7F298B|nr:uncharacterized protein INS49_011840 [Diaporthe citri]KAG6360774.1 hypothetical protein INS49_011840 [Diaporthe citri]
MDTVDRVNKLRSECNRIHEELAPERTAANESHKYPIRKFQELREILLPKSPSGSAGSSAEMQRLPDINDTHAAREHASLATGAPKFSFLVEGLKRIRQAIQRCWSRRNAGVNDRDRV